MKARVSRGKLLNVFGYGTGYGTGYGNGFGFGSGSGNGFGSGSGEGSGSEEFPIFEELECPK